MAAAPALLTALQPPDDLIVTGSTATGQNLMASHNPVAVAKMQLGFLQAKPGRLKS